MSEMIDRVAKAIVKAQDDWASGVLHHLSRGSIAQQRAIYAIEAMREPTEAMVSAKMDLGGYGYSEGECYCADPTEIWRLMIDEALR